MDYFWKENKKFVIAVGAGLLAVILYNSFVLGPIGRSADQAKARLAKEKAELKARMANGVPSEESLRAARATRDRLKQSLSSLVKDVEFRASDRLKKPDRENAKTHFESVNIDLYKDLHEKAVSAKIAFPSNLGLDSVNDDNAAEYLVRLGVVERVARAAIESEVDKIEAIDGLAGGAREEAAKKGFLTRYNVFMKLAGRADAIDKLVHGLQKKGSYLAVSGLEMYRDDTTKDLFTATLTVSLLKVDEKAPLEAK